MIMYLYGEEPYLIAEKIYMERKDREFFMTDDITDALESICSFGFFSNRVVHYSKEAPTAEELGLIMKSNADKSSNTLIITGNLQKRSKFYGWLEKHGTIIACNRLKEEKAIEFVAKKLKSLKTEITAKAAAQFMEQSGYYLEEVSLFHIQNELKKLSFISDQITEKEVEMLPKSIYVNQWKVIEDLNRCPGKFLSKTLSLAKEKDAVPLLSIYLRAFRIAYKVKTLRGFRQEMIGINQFQYMDLKWMERLSYEQIEQAILVLTEGIAIQKWKAVNPEPALVLTLTKLIVLVHKNASLESR